MSIQRHRRNVFEVGGNSKRQPCVWLPPCATSGNHSCYSTKMFHIYQNSGGYVDIFKHEDRSHLHRVMMCFISIIYTSIRTYDFNINIFFSFSFLTNLYNYAIF